MAENYTMHRQWATRPNDERYSTLDAMHAYLSAEAQACRTITADTDMLRVIPLESNDLGLVGKSGNAATLTNWSMNQICATAKSPSDYLRRLPATLAADCLNHGLQQQPRASHQLYLRQVPANGEPAHLELKALTSPGYSRVLSAHVVDRLRTLQQYNPDWKAPLVYDRGDFRGARTPVVGYAGDRDAYVCLQNESAHITDPANPSGDGLTRFVLLVNSEVGARKLDVTIGLCERICGNFIIWNAKTVAVFRMRHFGERIKREWQRGIGTVFSDYARMSATEQTAALNHAHTHQLGPKKDDVIDLLFRKEIATKQQLTDAYDLAEKYDRNPRTSWGMVHGLTRLSQQSPYADERVDLDRAASRVLDF
jgi:hypothetical protein